jgi:hypothetical protein
MPRSMHKTFQFIFIITLALYLVTLLAVPYVGVYLTYGAIPVIVLSGILANWLEPKEPDVLVEKTNQERLFEIEARLKDLEEK